VRISGSVGVANLKAVTGLLMVYNCRTVCMSLFEDMQL